MALDFDTQQILEALDALLTTRIPLELAALDALSAPTIPAPTGVSLRDDIDDPIPYGRPDVALTVGEEGAVIEDMLTPHRNHVIPLLVTVTLDFSSKEEEVIQWARYYARAVDMSLTRINQAMSVPGVYYINVTGQQNPEPLRDNSGRHSRRITVEATVYARTERAI
jgi:hypothetical protein